MKSMSVHSRGFALIELLVVMVVIFIMAALFLGRGTLDSHHKQLTECSKNLQSMYLAMSVYATENQDRFPALAGAATSEPALSLMVPRSTTTTEVFKCPGDRIAELPSGEPFADKKISYAYYVGWKRGEAGRRIPLVSDEQVDTNPRKQGATMFSTTGEGPGSNHKDQGGNMLYLDGSVETLPPLAPRDFSYPPHVTLLNPK